MAVKKKTGKKAAKRPAAKPKKAKPKKTAVRKKAVKKKAAAAGRKKPAGKPSRVRAATSALGTAKRNEYLRQILLKKRTEVVKGIEDQLGRKLSVTPGQTVDSAMDSADLSSQDMDQGVDYSLMEMRYEQYKDIADAFRRLENGTYGLCEECGQEIALKRLEVNPLARYCVACKTQLEEMQKIEREETRFKE
jgi:DnaK suppressor protein